MDWEEIISIPEKGIYRVRYREVGLKALKNKRSRTLREIANLRRRIIQDKTNIAELQRKLAQLEKIDFDPLIKNAEERKAEAEKRAGEFLKGWIGEANYERLEKEGFFIFMAQNGRRYRIKKNGQLQEDGGKWWFNLCTVKPNVPIPDVIVATFSATQNQNPELFGTTLKKQSREVVQKE